jgi:hypothetical protein
MMEIFGVDPHRSSHPAVGPFGGVSRPGPLRLRHSWAGDLDVGWPCPD